MPPACFLNAPTLPLMQCGEGVFTSIVRGDEGIAPYEVLPYLFVGPMPSSARRTAQQPPVVDNMSGSGAGRADDASCETITAMFRERAVRKTESRKNIACRKF